MKLLGINIDELIKRRIAFVFNSITIISGNQ